MAVIPTVHRIMNGAEGMDRAVILILLEDLLPK